MKKQNPDHIGTNKTPPVKMWPIQLKLSPIYAPYFNTDELLIAGSCTAFAHGSFREFTEGKTCLICCDKVNTFDAERLSKILLRNDVRSVRVIRMDVPCCGGLAMSVRKAIELSGKDIPIDVDVVTTNGEVNC